jgi:syntaxin 18
VRQAYLSTAQPRKTPTHISSARRKQERPQPLTDQERDDIDAKAKSLLRELNGQIHALEGAETLRLETETALLRKRFAPRFGRALGAWAAGADGSLVAEGAGHGGKGAEQIAAKRGAEQLKKHREGVLWLLKLRLERCGQVHTAMSQVRLTRQVEQARSVLAKTGGPSYADFAAAGGLTSQEGLAGSTGSLRSRALIEEEEREKQRRLTRDDDFTPEELQVFAKGNHDMLQHYETTLDKVKCVTPRPKMHLLDAQCELTRVVAGQRSSPFSRSPRSRQCWPTT